jgi:hypothetical protein
MKLLTSLSLITFIAMQSIPPCAQGTESKKAESQASPNNSKISSATIFANALLLAEIYRKIEKIANKEDKSQLTPLLNQLNTSLDQVLSFKDSFTPLKRQRIESQLFTLKNQIQAMTEIQSKELKNSSLQLASSLLDLVDVLLDRSKAESKPSTM